MGFGNSNFGNTSFPPDNITTYDNNGNVSVNSFVTVENQTVEFNTSLLIWTLVFS